MQPPARTKRVNRPSWGDRCDLAVAKKSRFSALGILHYRMILTRGRAANRKDFFVLESNDSVTTITPKPHRGQPVTDESLNELTQHLKEKFPVRQFFITVAVWDDSFAKFNPLKDALTGAGSQYRTLTCDSSSRLSNQAAAGPFVQ